MENPVEGEGLSHFCAAPLAQAAAESRRPGMECCWDWSHSSPRKDSRCDSAPVPVICKLGVIAPPVRAIVRSKVVMCVIRCSSLSRLCEGQKEQGGGREPGDGSQERTSKAPLGWGLGAPVFLFPSAICRASSWMEARGRWGLEDLDRSWVPTGQVTQQLQPHCKIR